MALMIIILQCFTMMPTRLPRIILFVGAAVSFFPTGKSAKAEFDIMIRMIQHWFLYLQLPPADPLRKRTITFFVKQMETSQIKLKSGISSPMAVEA